MKKKILFLVIILALLIAAGFFAYQWWQAKINVAFLQGGDIWVYKDFKNKYKLVDTEEAITAFTFSPDGKAIYWLNEKGELWKRSGEGTALLLAGAAGKTEYDKYSKFIDGYKNRFLEYCLEFKDHYTCVNETISKFDKIGKITNFELSPDGERIVYMPFSGYTGCCMGLFNVPVVSLWIMKNDGTEKVEIEHPSREGGDLMHFESWLPDSKKVIFYLQFPDEATQHSLFYEVGVDGKNPKIYSEIFKFFRKDVEIKVEDITDEDLGLFIGGIGMEPVYSPTGEKVAYLKYNKEGEQIRLKDIGTKETKTILESDNFPFDSAQNILGWSKDGDLLMVKTISEIFLFSKDGSFVLERKFGEPIPGFPGVKLIESAFISPDNRYIGGIYRTEKGGHEIIFLEDITTGSRKEFESPKPEYDSKKYGDWYIYNRPQFFSEDGNFCYLRKLPDAGAGELWCVNVKTLNNYLVAEDVLEAEETPK